MSREFVLVRRSTLEKLVEPGREASVTDGEWDELRAAITPLHRDNDGLDEYRQTIQVGELDPAQRLALARGEEQ